jgi:conjugal transfer mating pair stabilization protein TraN
MICAVVSARVITAAPNPDGYRCPAGQVLSGSNCLYAASSAPLTSTSCPTGWNLEGTFCTQTSSYAASLIYSCPHGGTLSGSDCVNEAASPASASSDCGTTSLQMANGFCMGSVATFSNCSVIAGNLTLDHQEFVSSISGYTVNLWFCYFKPHVTYSCSSGASLSGDQCLTLEQPGEQRLCLPSGGTLSGDTCNNTATQSATLVQTCPEGTSFDGQLCWQTISTPAEINWACPAGYALSGDVCSASETIAATPTYICAEGATLHGSQCLTTSAATLATYACPQGSSLSGSICLQGGTTTPAVTYLCAAGQILSGSNCLTYSAPLTSQGLSCTEPVETCTDNAPATRLVGGVAVTRSCWAWQRNYQCAKLTSGNDCGALEAKANCHFDHEVCLDEACQTKSRVFQCSTPAGPASGESFACSGDIYCLNGDCTEVKREASPDFAQALTAIHAMGEASGQFDQNSLQLFGGEAEGCHKPLFGLVNRCAGKSTGLIASKRRGGAGRGTGLSAVCWPRHAAPHPVPLFERGKAPRCEGPMGQCHYIGEYCSQKLLFVCGSLRKNYCCYESKLARLIQNRAALSSARAGAAPSRRPAKALPSRNLPASILRAWISRKSMPILPARSPSPPQSPIPPDPKPDRGLYQAHQES